MKIFDLMFATGASLAAQKRWEYLPWKSMSKRHGQCIVGLAVVDPLDVQSNVGICSFLAHQGGAFFDDCHSRWRLHGFGWLLKRHLNGLVCQL